MVAQETNDSMSSQRPIPPRTFPRTRTPRAQLGHHRLDAAIMKTAQRHIDMLVTHLRPIMLGNGEVTYVKALRVFQMQSVREKASKLIPTREIVPD